MSLYKVEAIVLKARNLGEADKILTLLTKNQGKLDAVAKGVRKIKSKNRGAVQPFSQSRIMLYQGKSMDTVTQCELISGFPKIRDNLDRLAYAGYIMELTTWILPEKEPQQEVYFLLLAILHLLQKAESKELIQLITRIYEVRLLNMLGYQPVLEVCANCGQPVKTGKIGFSPPMGGILCYNCLAEAPQVLPITQGLRIVWQLLTKINLTNIHRLKLREEELLALEKTLQSFMEYHLEHRMKSVDFIHELKKLTNCT
jgi:DNA repair protein RecO (recombination protein O)